MNKQAARNYTHNAHREREIAAFIDDRAKYPEDYGGPFACCQEIAEQVGHRIDITKFEALVDAYAEYEASEDGLEYRLRWDAVVNARDALLTR
jgi:hypothetical protein